MECKKLNWFCKHMKKVRSTQAAILVLNWVKQFFPVWIVNLFGVLSNNTNINLSKGNQILGLKKLILSALFYRLKFKLIEVFTCEPKSKINIHFLIIIHTTFVAIRVACLIRDFIFSAWIHYDTYLIMLLWWNKIVSIITLAKKSI